MRQRAAADIEAAKAQASSPTCGARSPRWPSAPPRRSSTRTSTRPPRRSSSRTTSTRSAGRGLMADDRIDAYAEALFEVAQPRAASPRSRTSCSASPACSRATTSCATRSPTRTIPVSRRQQIVEDLLGGKASVTTTALVSMVVGTGRSRDLPAIVDRWSSWRRRAEPQGGGRGPLGRRPHRRPARAPGRRPRGQGDRQAGRGEGRSSTRPCSAASSPRWATPSSTARSAPASSSSRPRPDDRRPARRSDHER